METLKIYQEYRFKKGGSEFYISESQNLKVKLTSGDVLEGSLVKAGQYIRMIVSVSFVL